MDKSLTAALIALIPAAVAVLVGVWQDKKHKDDGLSLTLGILAGILLWVFTLAIVYVTIT